MLDCADVYRWLEEADISFFCGVPDSLLKDFCAFISDQVDPHQHVIAANEGAAVALAAGYHLASERLALVYMQNSGLGNAVNPLLSLAHPAVYGIPMLLMVGWRGQPGVKDEPQHAQQGQATGKLLDSIGIDHALLPTEPEAARGVLESGVAQARDQSAPFAIVVQRGTFAKYGSSAEVQSELPLTREQALQIVLDGLDRRSIVVSTTGYTSREVYEYRAAHEGTFADFRTVGSMGHASQIALGMAMQRTDQEVCCLDGDGALIMHMGSLAVIGSISPPNFKHIVLNNGVHDSVGAQPTAGLGIDIPGLARACAYKHTARAVSKNEVQQATAALRLATGPALLEVQVRPGARNDLGRPGVSPQQAKEQLMSILKS